MNVTVIGTGFVGVVTSAVLAKFGNLVLGLDIDEEKISTLNSGKVPFFEPQLEELLQAGLGSKKLAFTSDYELAISEADVVIIAVGTPSAQDGTADLSYVLAAVKEAGKYLKPEAIVAIKSTVPPGTNEKVRVAIEAICRTSFEVVSLPEFLKEGSAVKDTLHPDRVVIGASNPTVIQKLLQLHEPLGGVRVVVSPESAQMAKYTANAYLAQRITFINQIANLCEKNGASITEVIEVIGKDTRIGGHYWYPGLGYGGSCFPKDVKELAAYSRSIGEGEGLLVKIDELNERRIEQKLSEYESKIHFHNKTVAVLGLSFKPNTNDLREAPSQKVIPFLKQRGAVIKAYDPEAMEEAAKLWPKLFYAKDSLEATSQAEVILVLVEWEEFRQLDLRAVRESVEQGCWLIDTRNLYERKTMEQLGFRYIGIGNP